MIDLVDIPYKEEDPVQNFNRIESLPSALYDLIEEAKLARERAEARFSGFLVGAALETQEGQIFHGSNFEPSNADTTCAERSLLCVARDARDAPEHLVIRRIAIVGGPQGQIRGNTTLTPCGRCRQVLFDHEVTQKSGIQVICATLGDGPVQVFSNARLLIPFAFGTELEPPTRSR